MKKLLVFTAAALLLAFVPEKTVTIKFSVAEINKHFSKLVTVRQIIDESDLPHQKVVFITKTIDSLLAVIQIQAIEQLKDTAKKADPK